MEKFNNMHFFDNGFYLVRTQAGFNRALKHYDSECELNHWSDNYPKKYPAVVQISRHYNGGGYSLNCVTYTVAEWRKYVAGIEAAIVQSDDEAKRAQAKMPVAESPPCQACGSTDCNGDCMELKG
jgi:hypothetical protein